MAAIEKRTRHAIADQRESATQASDLQSGNEDPELREAGRTLNQLHAESDGSKDGSNPRK